MATSSKPKPQTRRTQPRPARVKTIQRHADILALATERGLLSGPRTQVVRGRMPADLVAEAKRNSGIASDSQLLEVALANIALEDNFWEWMRAHRGTISPDIDLMSLID
jgi:hypothetical protein